MKTSRPHFEPNGSISIDGIEYRVEEKTGTDEFAVVRRDKNQVLGYFSVGSGLGGAGFRVDQASADPALVRAVAELVTTPRGVLPLQ